MKNDKGITLMVLILTIIVLLILAAFAMVMLTGENGLLSSDLKNEKNSALAEAKEKVVLAVNEAYTEYYKYEDTEVSLSSLAYSKLKQLEENLSVSGVSMTYSASTEDDASGQVTLTYEGQTNSETISADVVVEEDTGAVTISDWE